MRGILRAPLRPVEAALVPGRVDGHVEGYRNIYAAAFLDHFANPRRQGVLARATHRGEAEDHACGDRLWLDLEVEDGRIADARYRVQGCPGAIAAGSALASLLPGRRAVPGAVTREDLVEALGGVPSAKRHALGLALRVLAAALEEEPVAGGPK